MARKGQKFKYRDKNQIHEVVQEKISGKPYSYLEKKYGITRGTMMTWVKRYKDKGYVNRYKQGIKKDAKNMTIEELRLEVEILKKFQAFLKPKHKKR